MLTFNVFSKSTTVCHVSYLCVMCFWKECPGIWWKSWQSLHSCCYMYLTIQKKCASLSMGIFFVANSMIWIMFSWHGLCTSLPLLKSAGVQLLGKILPLSLGPALLRL